MDYKKPVLAVLFGGLAIQIVSMATNWLINIVWPYDVAMLGGVRALTDPIMILFLLHPWVLAIAMLCIYQHVKLSKGDYVKQGMEVGKLMWAVYALPSAFIVFTSMDYPFGFTVQSVIGSLLYFKAGGIALVKLMECC